MCTHTYIKDQQCDICTYYIHTYSMYMCIYIVCIYVTLLVFLMFYHIVVPQKLFTFFLKNKGPGHKPCMFRCVNQVKVFIFIKSQIRVLSVAH